MNMTMKPEPPILTCDRSGTSDDRENLITNKIHSDLNGNTRPIYEVVRHMKGE